MSDREDTSSCYSSDEEDNPFFNSFDDALDENVKWWFRRNGNVGHFMHINQNYTRNMITGRDGMPLDLLRELNRFVITHDGQPDLIGEDFKESDLSDSNDVRRSFKAHPQTIIQENRPDLADVPCHYQQRAYLDIICTQEQVEPITKALDEIGAYYVYGLNDDPYNVTTNYPPFNSSEKRCWLTKTIFATGDCFERTNCWKEIQVFPSFGRDVVMMDIFGQETTKIRDLLQALLNAVKED